MSSGRLLCQGYFKTVNLLIWSLASVFANPCFVLACSSSCVASQTFQIKVLKCVLGPFFQRDNKTFMFPDRTEVPKLCSVSSALFCHIKHVIIFRKAKISQGQPRVAENSLSLPELPPSGWGVNIFVAKWFSAGEISSLRNAFYLWTPISVNTS